MTPTTPKKPSILIVEDERIVAMDLQETLCAIGYEPIAIASSAEEAIARVSEKCPDIVLMDIRIKGPLDGIQTTEILKRQFDIPVVYLTAHADEATINRAKLTEPYGYLLKPVKSAELRSCIEVSLFKHQMERHLRAREHWFSTTLRSIADAVVTVDIGGKITFMNPAAEALIGLPAAEAIGKSAREVLRIVDEQSAEDDETPLDRALREMQPVALKEAKLLNLDTGAQRLINDSAAPVTDEKSTLGAVMVFRDVTEDKKLQKRMEFADRLASLGTMATGVAHEFNNPLTVVIANAALVSEDLERHRASLMAGASSQATNERLDEMAGGLRDLQSAANRMGRIISDLGAFSRPAPESSGLVELRECVQRGIRATSNEFRNRARLVTRFGEVSVVKADESRLGQVVVNLLVNAAQSIPPGSADRNEVSVATYTNDDGRAVLEVRDTGAGIPSDTIPRIFEPFFTTKDASTGTGLGLSICQGIVNSIGGEITVNSQIGKGTTIRVLLPPGATRAVGATGSVRTATPPLHARILVIDDEEMLLKIVRRTLEREGHEVFCVGNAREALALVEQGEQFDIILCDMMMPNMTGMEFYEVLLREHPDQVRRITFMTGGATTAREDAFLRSIPNLVLGKPFTPNSLAETVQQFLAATKGRVASS